MVAKYRSTTICWIFFLANLISEIYISIFFDSSDMLIPHESKLSRKSVVYRDLDFNFNEPKPALP